MRPLTSTSRRPSPRFPVGLLLALLFLLASPALAEDWLEWGGPRGDFTLQVEGLAEWWPEDGPPVLWKRALGGGYSSILSKGERLFTLYRDGDDEIVISLNARTGETVWEHRYKAEIWPDMSRAFGLGPNATPIIVGDRIVSIGINGQMRGLDLESGELIWKHDLPAEFGRLPRQEEYGYSGNPLQYQGNVLVLVGGDEHAVVAFEPTDGSIAWKSGPGGVSYAAPTLTTLGGRDQFVYFSPEGAVGLDPSTGRQLWHHPMEYNNGNHLTPIVKCDDSHIWVGSQFPTGGGRLLGITELEGTWTARQLWFETNLRASHWTSIRIGDFIYGSIGGNSISVLAAFDWNTGKIAWRQRGFHKAQSLYADGKLLFLDEGGALTLARVSPAKLDVLASAQVTESISWTLPTLVNTKLYLRDTENILALDLADTGAPRPAGATARTALAPPELLGEFGAFVGKVNGAEDKASLIDAYLAGQDSFPLIEPGTGEDLVHFVFRGDVLDIAVGGNFLELGQADPLYLVEGTDLYFRTYHLPPAAHFEYLFNVFDSRMPDPRNPRRLTPDDEDLSVFMTAGWQEPKHLRDPIGPRGRVETFLWKSDVLENEREIKVYLPSTYDSNDERLPVILVNYGDQALREGNWAASLDNLIGESVAPLIAVFLPRVDFDEYGPRVAEFSDAIAGELMPYLDQHYRTLAGPEHRAMTGIASGGFASVFTALRRPEVIGGVSVQSFYFRGEAEADLRSMIADGDGKTTRFYVEWSLNDLEAGEDLHSEEDSRELAELLGQEDYSVVTNEVVDGAGWGSWRASTDRILEGFFPLQP